MKIILDAMGGDNAPLAPVEGAIQAAEQLGVDVVLTGREPDIRACLEQLGRKSLPKGIITYGDVVGMAPFDHQICFFTLNGRQLMKVFEEIAATGGQGISHGVELVITPQLQLVSARLNGEPIDPGRQYRVATIDYVAQGNDKMPTFREGTNLVAPVGQENNSRFIIRDYFLAMKQQGKMIDAQKEGRITIKK